VVGSGRGAGNGGRCAQHESAWLAARVAGRLSGSAAQRGPLIVNNSSGAEAELGLDEAAAALATTIENLHPQHNGQWLDRFGQPFAYAW
jgi:hypothetical protein